MSFLPADAARFIVRPILSHDLALCLVLFFVVHVCGTRFACLTLRRFAKNGKMTSTIIRRTAVSDGDVAVPSSIDRLYCT